MVTKVEQAVSLFSDRLTACRTCSMPYEYKQFYRRKLPHVHSPGGLLFVTFRLAGSIPRVVIERWKREKELIDQEIRELAAADASDDLSTRQRVRMWDHHRKWFKTFEDVLHREEAGVAWLKDDRLAELVHNSLMYRDRKVYRLKVFCVMSNHVHVVFKPLLSERSLTEISGAGQPTRFVSLEPTLGAIMQSLKGYTAHEANKILGRTGPFWEEESYDHEVRDEEELGRIIRYVINNPVKAGLVKDWRDWKWTWLADT